MFAVRLPVRVNSCGLGVAKMIGVGCGDNIYILKYPDIYFPEKKKKNGWSKNLDTSEKVLFSSTSSLAA